ncbi:MAG: two-component system, OmpR family, response regulator MprA [Thermoleophilaceae bacterium]|jgi:two-component system OmpR family response regulator|nr:two-component system, OmpR family, response regulator MprA [Thermoleophilaceae bacterium]
MQPVTIGICEDDPELRSVLARALEHEGFQVRLTSAGHEAVDRFSADPPDVLVLDIGLPDADGRDVCQALRARGISSPVLFLTAREALTDRLAGFHVGGDDYLTKPFALAELLVRLHALARRLDPAPPPSGTELVLDPSTHDVRLGDATAPLTPTEFRLLAALAARPGEIIRRNQLVAAAWPDGAIVHDNTLDTYVGRLRRKLRGLKSEEGIETVRGVGYSLR